MLGKMNFCWFDSDPTNRIVSRACQRLRTDTAVIAFLTAER